MKKIYILVFILFFATLLRAVKLSSVPLGISNDEAYMFVNGYTISQTGRDMYGNVFPLIFRPGSGITTNPIPIYLVALSIKAFGYSLFAAKLPTILFSLVGIYVTYLFARELFNDERVALVSAFVLSVSPWHMYASRTGFEAVIAYSAVMAGFYYLLLCIKKGTSIFPVFICFIVVLFSYKAASLILLGGSAVFCVYAFLLGKNIWKGIVVFAVTSLLVICVWRLHLDVYNDFYSKDILVAQSNSIEATVNEERKQSDAPFWLQRIMTNKLSVRLKIYEDNYLNFFSMKNLFLPKGVQDNSYSLAGYGLLYIFELLLIPIGVYWLFRKSKKSAVLLSLLLLIVPLPVVISSPVYPLRCLIGVYILALCSGAGMVSVWDTLREKKYLGKYFIIGGIVFYAILFLEFSYLYFFRLPNLGFDASQTYDMRAYLLVAEKQKTAHKVIVQGVGENEFLQYAFWSKMKAADILETIASNSQGVMRYQNVEFLKVCPEFSDTKFPLLNTSDILVARYGCYPKHTPSDQIIWPKALRVYWNIFLPIED